MFKVAYSLQPLCYYNANRSWVWTLEVWADSRPCCWSSWRWLYGRVVSANNFGSLYKMAHSLVWYCIHLPRLWPSQVSCKKRKSEHVKSASLRFWCSPAASSAPMPAGDNYITVKDTKTSPRPSAFICRSKVSRSRTEHLLMRPASEVKKRTSFLSWR